MSYKMSLTPTAASRKRRQSDRLLVQQQRMFLLLVPEPPELSVRVGLSKPLDILSTNIAQFNANWGATPSFTVATAWHAGRI